MGRNCVLRIVEYLNTYVELLIDLPKIVEKTFDVRHSRHWCQ